MQKQLPIVLIVDDEPLGRDSLESLLLNHGYQLAFAANGAEALQQAAQLIPDLILLDVMMPDMDGFEVCRRLREDPVLADVPVVLVTALDDRDSRLLGIDAGADDFVTKPFDRAELRTRVRTITRLNRFRRLLAERTKFEWVVSHANDGYLIADDNGYIEYANPQARLFLGLPQNEDTPISETFHQLIRKQYQPEPESAWVVWPSPSNDGQTRYLVRPETPASLPLWLRVETLELKSPSANTGASTWMVQLCNVTTQMALAHDNWHFHAMVSHKFRTPLIPLVSGIDLMRKHNDSLSESDKKAILDQAHQGIMRLHLTVNDILEYLNSTSQARSEPTLLKRLPALLENLVKELELDNVTTSLDPWLQGNNASLPLAESTISLILREVLENSQKFHPTHSPEIQIEVNRSVPDSKIQITVSDDGIHLASDQIAQVWTPYYQAEKYFTGEFAGTGLGLAMVASTVWGVGGTCRMHNRADIPGIVVNIILPIQPPPSEISPHEYTEMEWPSVTDFEG
ncbi:MAG: response regulator [Anaerolineae bacterium]